MAWYKKFIKRGKVWWELFVPRMHLKPGTSFLCLLFFCVYFYFFCGRAKVG